MDKLYFFSGEKKSALDYSGSSGQNADAIGINSLMDTNFKDPAECAKGIIKSLWSTEALQDRVVRKIQGNNKQPLTPEKVEKGKNMFSQWLKIKVT